MFVFAIETEQTERENKTAFHFNFHRNSQIDKFQQIRNECKQFEVGTAQTIE